MNRRWLGLLMSTAILAFTVGAQQIEHAAASAKHPFTIDDLLSVRKPGTVKISPDGSHIFYSVEEPVSLSNSKARPQTTFWLLDVNSRKTIQCADQLGSSLQWSPDSRMLTFMSNREGSKGNQIF